MKRVMRMFPKLAAMVVVVGIAAILFGCWFFLRYPELKKRNLAADELKNQKPFQTVEDILEKARKRELREGMREDPNAKSYNSPINPIQPPFQTVEDILEKARKRGE